MANKTQNTIQITKSIIHAASIYKTKLVGYSFMYIFNNKSIEVIYRAKDFMHLTGVDSKLYANEFYREAVRGTLQHNQISFSQRHPYDLCVQKMTQLKNISAVTDSEIIILEDLKTNSFSYKFGLTELHFTLCLSEDINYQGKIVSDKYVSRSLRIEDSFKRSSNAHKVQHILAKKNDEKLYNILKYSDKNFDILNLPQEILNKIDFDLITVQKDSM